MSLGTLEIGKKHGNDLELEVTRLEVLLDGEEQLLIDKINFIYKVQGTDLLAAVRVQMGLNA
jgi:phage tail tube protein FII